MNAANRANLAEYLQEHPLDQLPLCAQCGAQKIARGPVEAWRTADGRLLLHHDGGGHNQTWIELDLDGQQWLHQVLQESLKAAEEGSADGIHRGP